jgi:hypothetical protein
MISPDLIGNQERPRSIPSSKLRLLIITDSDERLSKLKAALNTGEVEIACAASRRDVLRMPRRPRFGCDGCLPREPLRPSQDVEGMPRLHEESRVGRSRKVSG